MAAKKKKAKSRAGARKLEVADLRTATLKSVKAAIGKLPGGGIINGFVLDQAVLKGLGVTAEALAKDIAASTGAAAGMRLKSAVVERGDTIVVGFLPPKTALPRS